MGQTKEIFDPRQSCPKCGSKNKYFYLGEWHCRICESIFYGRTKNGV